jgi:hypothetical protein
MALNGLGRPLPVQLKALGGPGGLFEPATTVMLPNEAEHRSSGFDSDRPQLPFRFVPNKASGYQSTSSWEPPTGLIIHQLAETVDRSRALPVAASKAHSPTVRHGTIVALGKLRSSTSLLCSLSSRGCPSLEHVARERLSDLCLS